MKTVGLITKIILANNVMKNAFYLALMTFLLSCTQKSDTLNFLEYPHYAQADLGLSLEGNTWSFKVWSPTASRVILRLYETGSGGQAIDQYTMTKGGDGIWEFSVAEDKRGLFYTFQATVDGAELDEVVDPYVKLVGVNGKRGFIGLPSDANPEDWEYDESPELNSFAEIILYELHVRDFSIDESSGIGAQGKFLAFTEEGTVNPDGLATGLDHMVDLGITHVHLLPSFDFRSIDESDLAKNKYNWGYDPQNYNVPEGSYSTDPADPYSRIREFKQLVMSLHEKGIRVVMDVVYNHTGYTEESLFNQLVPGYYYRQDENGGFSDAAACGNEVASERSMVRKFMIESVKYWVEEFHIDGFRFDLMGIHDLETMNTIAQELRNIDPDIFIYGEGWTAGVSPIPDSLRALKVNTYMLDGIAAFSDDLRDGIKGSVFEDLERGFVTGLEGTKESIKFGIVGSTEHEGVDYEEVNYSKAPWASSPLQCINYVSCHDNMTLWDKLKISQPEASIEELMAMHKLANTIVLTSQGVPFLHAGVEFLRSKGGEHNSFESPDSVNSIKWDQKSAYQEVNMYYKNLIALRKSHPAFRMSTTDELNNNLRFMEIENPLVVGYWLGGNANGDEWETIGVVFNGSEDAVEVDIPVGQWVSELKNGEFRTQSLTGGSTSLARKSALIFHN